MGLASEGNGSQKEACQSFCPPQGASETLTQHKHKTQNTPSALHHPSHVPPSRRVRVID